MVIYKITNKNTGKCYVGQTIDDIKNRLRMHFSNNENTNVSYIRRAIKKHGKDNFSVGILGSYETVEDLNSAEEYFIEFHNCLAPNGYNLIKGGKNRRPSEITRLRQSLSHLGKTYPTRGPNKNPAWNKGKKGLSHCGFQKGHKDYTQHLKQPVLCSNGIVYSSISLAAKALNTSSGKICAVLKGTRNHTKGLTFTKVTNASN